MTPQKKVLLPLAVGVVLLILTTGFFVSTSIEMIRTVNEAEGIGVIMYRISDVLSMLQDAESGQRGYLLTGKISYLEPYHSSLNEIDERISLLREMCVGDPDCLQRIQQLQSLKDAKFAEMGRTIRLQQSRRTADALRIIESGESRREMDSMRAILAELGDNFRLKRTTYSNWVAQEVVRAEYSFLAVTVLITLIVFLSYRTASTMLRRDAELKVRLEEAALHDQLTGLPNRRFVSSWLPYALSQVRREHTKLAALFVDLDDFKEINDRWGHTAGDKVLVHAAERFRDMLRQSDILARVGGDEFVILIPNAPSREKLIELSSRLAESLKTLADGKEAHLWVNASVGIALFPDDASTEDELLSAADSAMYAAKRQIKKAAQKFPST
ncbi:MAG: diguanylate cyclase [Burkholderiales bacterium]